MFSMLSNSFPSRIYKISLSNDKEKNLWHLFGTSLANYSAQFHPSQSNVLVIFKSITDYMLNILLHSAKVSDNNIINNQ